MLRLCLDLELGTRLKIWLQRGIGSVQELLMLKGGGSGGSFMLVDRTDHCHFCITIHTMIGVLNIVVIVAILGSGSGRTRIHGLCCFLRCDLLRCEKTATGATRTTHSMFVARFVKIGLEDELSENLFE